MYRLEVSQGWDNKSNNTLDKRFPAFCAQSSEMDDGMSLTTRLGHRVLLIAFIGTGKVIL